MANTTNFNWETPDDTDLVKDGAAAIRTLGSAIDTSLVDLKGGTTGQVLSKASNTDLDFTWAAGGSGLVKQVVSASYNTQTSTSSATYSDTGLTATITPTNSSSKILVLVFQNGMYKTVDSADTSVGLRLMRGATAIISKIDDYVAFTNTTTRNGVGASGVSYLDSPATTSAVTYKTQFKSTAGTATAYVNFDGAYSTITLIEVGE